VRKYYLGRAKGVAPLGEGVGILLKAPEMVFNERKGR
jgi:hypothetical protein